MISNTSETKESLLRYTIPELETMVDALSENNGSKDGKNSKRMEGMDALKYLMTNKNIF